MTNMAKPSLGTTQSQITSTQIRAISDLELAFGTTKLLPEWDAIPIEFKRVQNPYQVLLHSLFYHQPIPRGQIALNPGFDDIDMAAVNKCIRAHLQSYAPKHEHKMAGTAFLLSQICTLELDAQ